MSETLALKYRPARFSDMVGQGLVSGVLERMVANGTVPKGLLFSGIHGTGKTSAARILSRELNPEFPEAPVVEIDAASNGGVADVRALINTLRYGAPGVRVIILDEAHSLTREAFNTLLKTLEEPPENTHFVLVTTEPQKLPDTVLSRLVSFEFVKISPNEVAQRLSDIRDAENCQIDDDLILQISNRVDGSMRDAIMAFDQCVRAGIRTVEQYRAIAREEDIGPKFIANLATGDPTRYFALLEKTLLSNGNPSVIYDALVFTLRDLMVLKAGGDLSIVGSELEHRKLLSATLDAEQMVSAIKVLWELKTRLRFQESNPSNITLALVLLAEVLGGNRPQG